MISWNNSKFYKTGGISWVKLTCDLSRDKTSTFVLPYPSRLLFSVGKANSWYRLGLVSLILRILFHTKYQRYIPAVPGY